MKVTRLNMLDSEDTRFKYRSEIYSDARNNLLFVFHNDKFTEEEAKKFIKKKEKEYFKKNRK